MKMKKTVRLYGITDVGCVRSGNEDCYLIQRIGDAAQQLNPTEETELDGQSDILLAVSDGMGGAAAGEVASQTALQALAQYAVDHAKELQQADPDTLVRLLEKGVIRSNEAIFEKARELNIRKTMGATITAAYIRKDVLYLFQVGDSRAYIMRANRLYRVTRDQSFVGHLVEMGTITETQALRHPQRNVILQALGTQEDLKTDVSYLPLCRDDLLMICSDGLYSEFEPDALARLFANWDPNDLSKGTQKLLDQAKDSGGKDNITIVCARMNGDYPPRQPGEDPRYLSFPYLEKTNPLHKADSLFR